MGTFVKKPVRVEAIQYIPEDADHVIVLIEWMTNHGQTVELKVGADGTFGDLDIMTLEDGDDGRAKHVASPGDWIIRGVQGEFYPVKNDIFLATYEAADAS